MAPRRRRGGGRHRRDAGLARLLGRLLGRGLGRRLLSRGFRDLREREYKKRQRMSAPRTHGLLLRRRLGSRLSSGLARRGLLLFGGGRGPAASARAEPRQIVAARLVDGLLVTLELRRFVLEVQLLRVAARDVVGIPRAVYLRGIDGMLPPRHLADASSNFQLTAFEAFLTQRCIPHSPRRRRPSR